MIGTLRGKAYRYVGKEARCVNCGARLFVPDFLDYNLRTLYDVYRKENNIVSLEQIGEIPKKYAVGERPLSLLLGWDERAFSRYADGDIPSKQRSDILTRLYNDPAFFAELLQADEAHESIERNDKLMDDISRKSLTLNGLVQMRRDRIHRRNPEDGKVRTLMDLENVCESNALEDFTSLQWSKYPPFRGWDD